MLNYVKKKWVKALRSGDYKQGTSFLAHRPFKSNNVLYCCLGVLLEVEHVRNIGFTDDLNKGPGTKYIYDDENNVRQIEGSYLPVAFARRLGLERDPFVTIATSTEDERTVRLSELNDEGCSFDDIADIIEEQL